MVRSIGRAAFGAVAVGGGAENVRLPRLPKLDDGRASTVVATVKDSAASIAASAKNRRELRNMGNPSAAEIGLCRGIIS
jgi:hypothetical protein